MSGRRVEWTEPFVFCPVCRQMVSRLETGFHGRPNVACPNCGTLDRHRLTALLVLAMIPTRPAGTPVLEIAPTTVLSDLVRDVSGSIYLTIDRFPETSLRKIDVKADVVSMPLASKSVGFVLCSHVLEHVPDDRAAAAEIARVLHPQGSALVITPRRRGQTTDEDPDATPEERIRRFNQADHVRYYGDDLEERLESAGLRVATYPYEKLLPRPLLDVIGVYNNASVWIVTTGRNPTEFVDQTSLTRILARRMLTSRSTGAPDDLETRLQQTLDEANDWKGRYEWLESRPIVRWGRWMKNLLGR